MERLLHLADRQQFQFESDQRPDLPVLHQRDGAASANRHSADQVRVPRCDVSPIIFFLTFLSFSSVSNSSAIILDCESSRKKEQKIRIISFRSTRIIQIHRVPATFQLPPLFLSLDISTRPCLNYRGSRKSFNNSTSTLLEESIICHDGRMVRNSSLRRKKSRLRKKNLVRSRLVSFPPRIRSRNGSIRFDQFANCRFRVARATPAWKV